MHATADLQERAPYATSSRVGWKWRGTRSLAPCLPHCLQNQCRQLVPQCLPHCCRVPQCRFLLQRDVYRYCWLCAEISDSRLTMTAGVAELLLHRYRHMPGLVFWGDCCCVVARFWGVALMVHHCDSLHVSASYTHALWCCYPKLVRILLMRTIRNCGNVARRVWRVACSAEQASQL